MKRVLSYAVSVLILAATIFAVPVGNLYYLDRIDSRFIGQYDQNMDIAPFNAIGPGYGVDIYILARLPVRVGHTEFEDTLPGTTRLTNIYGGFSGFDFCNGSNRLWSHNATFQASIAAGKTIGIARRANIRAYSFGVTGQLVDMQNKLTEIKNSIIARHPIPAIVFLPMQYSNENPCGTNGLAGSPFPGTHPIQPTIDVVDQIRTQANALVIFNAALTKNPSICTNDKLFPQAYLNGYRVGMTENFDRACGGNFFNCSAPQGQTIGQYFHRPENINLFAPSWTAVGAFGPCGSAPDSSLASIFPFIETGSSTEEWDTHASGAMATGIAADFLSATALAGFRAHWYQVKQFLDSMATFNAVQNTGGTTPNTHLIYNGRNSPATTVTSYGGSRTVAKGSLITVYGDFTTYEKIPLTPNRVFIDYGTGQEVEITGTVSYWSPTQINAITPTDMPVPAMPAGSVYAMKVYYNQYLLGYGVFEAKRVAPKIATYDTGNPTSLANGSIQRYSIATGAFLGECAINSPNGCDWNPTTENAFLIGYGSGARYYETALNGPDTNSFIGGFQGNITYIGPSAYAGLDQFNIQLPASARNAGLVDIFFKVDGVVANLAKVYLHI